MAQLICEDCKKNKVPLYRKKYCDDCANRRKLEYEAQKEESAQQEASNAQNQGFQEGRHDIVVSRAEKPHSYEFGPAKARHKIYYGEVNDLKGHIEMLKAAGLYEEFETEKVF